MDHIPAKRGIVALPVLNPHFALSCHNLYKPFATDTPLRGVPMRIQKNAMLLKQPKEVSPSLKLFYRKPGPAVPGLYGLLGYYLDRGDVSFGHAGDVGRFGGAITKNGDIEIVAIYDKKEGCLKWRTVPELFNDKKFKDNIAPYSKLGKYFYDDNYWNAGDNAKILSDASPMLTATFGMLASMPLGDLETTSKGNIVIRGSYNGNTEYIGPTKDNLKKAGINLDAGPMVFLATKTGLKIVDATDNGKSYAIKSILEPEEIKTSLLAFYGNFENGQKRKFDNQFGIPVGDLV
jgi:hypothetical protein